MSSVGTKTRPRGRAPGVKRADRRRQILEAATESISRFGYANTTLATVAERAGLTQAALVFHFSSKEELLTEALRSLSEVYTEAWHAALAEAGDDPLARICAMVATEFRPDLCDRRTLAVWNAFWAEAQARPHYQRICGERDGERYDAMKREVGRLLAQNGPTDPRTADDVAVTIDSMLDGLAERMLGERMPLNRDDAIRIAFAALRALLPDQEDVIAAWEAFARKQRPPKTGNAGSARRVNA